MRKILYLPEGEYVLVYHSSYIDTYYDRIKSCCDQGISFVVWFEKNHHGLGHKESPAQHIIEEFEIVEVPDV